MDEAAKKISKSPDSKDADKLQKHLSDITAELDEESMSRSSGGKKDLESRKYLTQVNSKKFSKLKVSPH